MSDKKNPIRFQVFLFTLVRIVLNTAFRMVYPFLPHISRGLNISLEKAAGALSIRAVAGIFSPFIASVSDSRSRKTGMLLGVSLFVGGIAVVIFWPTYWGLVVSLVLVTLGKFTHDPAMQAYLGDKVKYEQRGSMLAITEMGWSGAFFLGMPLVGFLIARAGWLAPFPLLALLGLLSLWVLNKLLPNEPHSTSGKTIFQNFGLVFRSPSALAGLSMILMISVANEVVNLVFGVWLENTFQLQVTALGLAAIVIGVSEFFGESLVSIVSDRLGKRRAIGLGMLGNSMAAIALPYLAQNRSLALLGLFIFYLFFEFTFVSAVPLMTEILPQARATLMAINIATTSLGRAIAALITPAIFALGFGANTIVTAFFNLLAFLALQQIFKLHTTEKNHI